MNAQQIFDLLRPWEDACREADWRLTQLARLVGTLAETPLGDAVNGLADAYTTLLAKHLDFDADTLTDWAMVHEGGAQPMHAALRGEPLRSISTTE